MHRLDSDGTWCDSSLIESPDEGGAQLACWIGLTLEVVRPVGDHLCATLPHILTVEVGDDEDRFFGTKAEERGYRHKWVRDRPVLNRRLEAPKVCKRLRV